MNNQLDAIFKPKSIAVLGASSKKGTIGYAIFNNLIRYNFKGKLYPVNPKSETINGLKCYPAILDIPDKIDLAIIVVPRDLMEQAVDECGQKGVSCVIAITSGFKEIGKEGAAKERKLVELIRKYGMRMIGPNCYGVLNTDPAYLMNGTFSKLNPLPGKMAFLSQSGSLGEVVIDYTNKLNLGFSMFASIGNKADISDIDILEYWKDDPESQVILLYLENIENSSEFIKITHDITRNKPILAIKAGRTESGARAISSHTGVLAGGDVGVDALFEKCGIIRVDAFDELFDMAMALSSQPPLKGDRIAVITNAGGPGILATDAIEKLGLKMARFEQPTIDFLRAHLSPMAAVNNPIDVIASGGPESYAAAVEASLKDPNVDGLIVIYVPPILIDHKVLIDSVIDRVTKYQNGKPVLSCLMGSPGGIPGADDLIKKNIPIYTFPEGAAKGMAAMMQYRKIRQRMNGNIRQFNVDKAKIERFIESTRKANKNTIIGDDALAILNAYGVGIVKSIKAKTENELFEALNILAYPIAMKTDDPTILHKTEVGGVILNLNNKDSVIESFNKMKAKFSGPDRDFAGVVLQEMVTDGVETIIGMNGDPFYGPLIMFGLGGVQVELMKDVAFRVGPLSDIEADELIRSIKSFPLLNGFRGSTPVDLNRLSETIQRLSQLASDFHDIESFDLNPFLASANPEKSKALDARFILKNLRR